MAGVQKVPKLRVAKKNKQANRRIIFLLFLFFMSLLLILFFRSSFGKVQNISVKGNQWVSTGDILQKSGISKGTSSLIFMNKGKVEQSISSSFPVVQKVTLTKVFPGSLVIDVTERPIVAFMQKDGKAYPVFDNGTVLTTQTITKQIGDKPRLSSWANLSDLPRFINEYNQLDSEVKALISEIVYTGDAAHPDTLTLYMKEGYEVRTVIQGFANNMAKYPTYVKTLKLDGKNNGIIHLSEVKYFEPYKKQ